MTRTGAALPAVLLAMALMSALVVGGVYAARTLRIGARLARSSTELYSPVERVLVEAVARWDSTGRAAMPIGAAESGPQVSIDGIPVTIAATRLNERTYWLVAEAQGPASHRIASRLGVLVRVVEGRIRPVPGPAWTRLP